MMIMTIIIMIGNRERRNLQSKLLIPRTRTPMKVHEIPIPVANRVTKIVPVVPHIVVTYSVAQDDEDKEDPTKNSNSKTTMLLPVFAITKT